MSQGFVGIQCLDLGTAQYRTGLKFLCRKDPRPALPVEEYFMYASKRSWKLTAVSLISLIVRLSPSCGTQSLNLYSGDRVFQKLCDQSTDSPAIATLEEADKKIRELVEESEKDSQVIGHGRDSVDWKKAAAGNALYKLCKSIDCTSGGNFMELLDELHNALADIIGACIKQVGVALLNSSKKWVQNLQERKLLEAVYVAGKSRGLMEELGWSPDAEDVMV